MSVSQNDSDGNFCDAVCITRLAFYILFILCGLYAKCVMSPSSGVDLESPLVWKYCIRIPK